MPELCVYYRAGNGWVGCLRPARGAPPCWWSDWHTRLPALLRVGRNQAVRMHLPGALVGLLVELRGPLAGAPRGAALFGEGRRHA